MVDFMATRKRRWDTIELPKYCIH